MQDYFAAQFIYYDAKAEQKAILEKIYSSNKAGSYRNILDIYHDTDPKLFRRVLTRRLLRDFIHYYDSTYQKPLPGVSAAQVDRRKRVTFARDVIFCLLHFEAVGRSSHDAVRKSFTKMKALVEKRVTGRSIRQSVIWGFGLTKDCRLGIVDIAQPGFTVMLVLSDKRHSFMDHPEGATHAQYDGEGLAEDKPMTIDDDPDSVLNIAKNFSDVTDTISDGHRLLNYEKAKAYLKEIDEELIGEGSQKALADDI